MMSSSDSCSSLILLSKFLGVFLFDGLKHGQDVSRSESFSFSRFLGTGHLIVDTCVFI